jgi:hypothetical protein
MAKSYTEKCLQCAAPFTIYPCQEGQKRRFCSVRCRTAYGRSEAGAAERFWAKVERADGCWQWTGNIDKPGYGHFKWGRRMFIAHRVAYMLTRGPIPKGLFVCHTCDHRSCVNPAHLWLGTAADNMTDKVEKDRQSGYRPGDECPKGHVIPVRGRCQQCRKEYNDSHVAYRREWRHAKKRREREQKSA